MFWTALETKPTPCPQNRICARTSRRTSVGCAERKRAFGIDTAAPESDSVSEFLIQPSRVHVRRRRPDRVEDVKPRGDEIFDQRVWARAGEFLGHIWATTNFRHRLTNATAEGLNSKIQMVKEMACGFGNREHYKTAIYFHCGGLDLYPRVEASA